MDWWEITQIQDYTDSMRRGFTLIELLVVISIIGLLSSITLASLSTARAKAHDSARKQELNEIKNALDLYYAKHGKFPNSGAIDSSDPHWLQVLVDDEDIGSSPLDPVNANTGTACDLNNPTPGIPSSNSLFTLQSYDTQYVLCTLLEAEPSYLVTHDARSVLINNGPYYYKDLHYPTNAYIIQEDNGN